MHPRHQRQNVEHQTPHPLLSILHRAIRLGRTSNSSCKELSRPHITGILPLTRSNNILSLTSIPQPDTPPVQPLDTLSARTYLSSALSQFLGVTGTAIPIDILKVEPKGTKSNGVTKYDSVWVRVPRDDGAAVVAAISSWIGGSGSGAGAAWRVCAKGNYLGALVSGSGSDLFVP